MAIITNENLVEKMGGEKTLNKIVLNLREKLKAICTDCYEHYESNSKYIDEQFISNNEFKILKTWIENHHHISLHHYGTQYISFYYTLKIRCKYCRKISLFKECISIIESFLPNYKNGFSISENIIIDSIAETFARDFERSLWIICPSKKLNRYKINKIKHDFYIGCENIIFPVHIKQKGGQWHD